MILLWKLNRIVRLPKTKNNRNHSMLFEPVIGLNRNHCWIKMNKQIFKRWKKKRLPKKRWYILIWKRERYIDKNNIEKQSIYIEKMILLGFKFTNAKTIPAIMRNRIQNS